MERDMWTPQEGLVLRGQVALALGTPRFPERKAPFIHADPPPAMSTPIRPQPPLLTPTSALPSQPSPLGSKLSPFPKMEEG